MVKRQPCPDCDRNRTGGQDRVWVLFDGVEAAGAYGTLRLAVADAEALTRSFVRDFPGVDPEIEVRGFDVAIERRYA